MKTLITGGMVVTPHEVLRTDLLLAEGRVAALGRGLPAEGAEVLDASGCFVLPGGVDAHTHITLDIDAARGRDVFYSGTIPAALGGTTTIIDHLAFNFVGRPLSRQIEFYHKEADGGAVVDYGFHGVVQRADKETMESLDCLAAAGYTSCKAYMTYDFRLDDEDLYRLLCRTRQLGMVLAAHAENHEGIAALRSKFKAEGKGDPVWHAKSRPVECEAEAVRRLLKLARRAGDAPVYVVHLSTALGLEEIKKARAAGQKHIFAETCTQYLTLTEEKYADPLEGLRYIMSPPLRTQADVAALWQGLKDGDIQVVATDHCAFTLGQKRRGLHDFTACPGGAPGLEERMPVMFSEGVAKGRLNIRAYADLCCANPARIFGLYPRKGALLPGSDADVLVLNPEPERRLVVDTLHGPSDYSPYAGMNLRGRIEAVFLRGRLVARGNVFLGGRGAGCFMARRRGMLD